MEAGKAYGEEGNPVDGTDHPAAAVVGPFRLAFGQALGPMVTAEMRDRRLHAPGAPTRETGGAREGPREHGGGGGVKAHSCSISAIFAFSLLPFGSSARERRPPPASTPLCLRLASLGRVCKWMSRRRRRLPNGQDVSRWKPPSTRKVETARGAR